MVGWIITPYPGSRIVLVASPLVLSSIYQKQITHLVWHAFKNPLDEVICTFKHSIFIPTHKFRRIISIWKICAKGFSFLLLMGRFFVRWSWRYIWFLKNFGMHHHETVQSIKLLILNQIHSQVKNPALWTFRWLLWQLFFQILQLFTQMAWASRTKHSNSFLEFLK